MAHDIASNRGKISVAWHCEHDASAKHSSPQPSYTHCHIIALVEKEGKTGESKL